MFDSLPHIRKIAIQQQLCAPCAGLKAGAVPILHRLFIDADHHKSSHAWVISTFDDNSEYISLTLK